LHLAAQYFGNCVVSLWTYFVQTSPVAIEYFLDGLLNHLNRCHFYPFWGTYK